MLEVSHSSSPARLTGVTEEDVACIGSQDTLLPIVWGCKQWSECFPLNSNWSQDSSSSVPTFREDMN